MNTEEAREERTFKPGFQPWTWLFGISFGLAAFHTLGWTYQSSWYGYYGIDAHQMNVPRLLTVEQGMLLLLVSLTFILAIFGALFLLRLIVLFVRSFFPGERRGELSSLFSLREFFRQSQHLVAPVYVALIYVFRAGVAKNSNYSELQLPATVHMVEWFMIPVAAILVIRLLGDGIGLLPVSFQQRLRLKSEVRMIDDSPYRVVLEILAIFSVLTIFIGTLAVGDASVGYRENGSYQSVQRVYLESYLPIAGLEAYRRDCDCNPYVYGPLGYLGSNQDYLFLIPWKGDGQEYFPQFPPLYQIERSGANTINIIPFRDGP